MQKYLLLLFTMNFYVGFGQSYTSYLTGNSLDVVTNPIGGICLMGGATENDNAMKWFLQRANGGDVLVLRTSGSDGYNSYLYSDLGIVVNSVETIVCNDSTASNDPYVLQKIQQAEAIWFAGGDQWTYIRYWRNSQLNIFINQAILERNVVIGGTSAGMAIQGKYCFSAQNGTVTSSSALTNPFNNLVTVDSNTFLKNAILDEVITDTHFDNPDRKGRLVTFLARIHEDYGIYAKAVACDEYTAVCIDTNGVANVYGGYPTYDDNAYFIQSNCELPIQSPESCTFGTPLTWNLDGFALKAYQIKGNSAGSNSFDLNTWQTATGGTWYDWSVTNGVFSELSGAALNCSSVDITNIQLSSDITAFPNPTSDKITISIDNGIDESCDILVINNLGQRMQLNHSMVNSQSVLDFKALEEGIYFLLIRLKNGTIYKKKIIKC